MKTQPGTAHAAAPASSAMQKLQSNPGDALLEQAKNYALEYRREIVDRTVFPSGAALRGLDIFDEPLPFEPADPRRVLELLQANQFL